MAPAATVSTADAAPMIAIRGLRVAYGATEVLKGVDLDVPRGHFVALLGPSGCGKTTLLRTISGFTPASAGRIDVEGRDILAEPPERRGMAMVFQSYALWSHMTVAQNIGYGLKLRGWPKARIAQRVAELLAMLGLPGHEDRHVASLSGGQRQRVALGRALAVDPKILLLDEPLSNLDARIRLQMRHEIRTLQRQLGVTAILVTHDREEAMAMADQVVVLDQGRVAQAGTPEAVYTRPQSAYVAAFMGAENGLDADARRRDDRHLTLEVGGQRLLLPLPDGLPPPPDGPVRLLFRSEAARLAAATEPAPPDALALPGRVLQAQYLGGAWRCEVQTPGGRFHIDHPVAWPADAAVQVCIAAPALHVFPREPGG